METTTNYEKHTVKNPISKYFLNNFLKRLIAEISPLQPISILDVGAGEGFTLRKLQEAGVGKKLEGVDSMDEAITIGKKVNPGIILKKGDAYQLAYKDNSFDLVICTEVLEHLEKPEKALQELIRVSKKYVVVSVPHEPLFTIQRFFRGKNMLHLGDHPEHIQHWTSKSFLLFTSQYMDIKTARYPVPWTMVIGEKRD